MRKLARILLLLPLLLVLQGQVTQQSKVVSIISFGGDPTGVADVQPAIARAQAAGATRINFPPGQYLLAGAGTVALANIEIECQGAIAGYNQTSGQNYGTTGATFWMTSTSVKPFTVSGAGGGVRIHNCNFFWPNQTGVNPTPIVYPPLFSEPPGTQLNSFECVSCRIINGYDFLVQQNTTDAFGAIKLVDTYGYVIHTWFKLSFVSEWVTITGFHADAGVYQSVANVGPNYYLINWTYANGTVFDVFGNGNGSTVGSTVSVGGISFNGVVYGYNKFIWVESTGFMSESQFHGIADTVPHVIEVDNGGCIGEVEWIGSVISFLGVAPNPLPGGTDNATPFTFGTSPTSNCATNEVTLRGDTASVQGDVVDINGGKSYYINFGANSAYGYTSAAGTYYFAQVNAANAIVDFAGNHIEPYAPRIGSTRQGINIQSCLSCTLTGNSFNGVYNEITLGGAPVGHVTGSGNISVGSPIGGRAVVGTGDDAHRLLAGSSWDQNDTAVPVVSSCGTSPSINGNSSDISGTVGIGSGAPGNTCTVTFANVWSNIPRCYIGGIQGAGQPISPAVSTSAIVVTTGGNFASNTLTYRCDLGW